jgi:hypothetical protein
LDIRRRDAKPQGQRNESDIDEVEPNHQQVVDRIRQPGISVETIHEEDTPISVQGAGHPDSERDADGEVGEVGPNDECHRRPFYLL